MTPEIHLKPCGNLYTVFAEAERENPMAFALNARLLLYNSLQFIQ